MSRDRQSRWRKKNIQASETSDFDFERALRSSYPFRPRFCIASARTTISVLPALKESAYELSDFSRVVTETSERAHPSAAWQREGQRDSLQTRVSWNMFSSSSVGKGTLPAIQQPTAAEDMADALALLLNEEADLRGID